MKVWRQNKAHELVFGPGQSDDETTEPRDGGDPVRASVRQLNPIPGMAMDPGVGSPNRHVGRSRNDGEH